MHTLLIDDPVEFLSTGVLAAAEASRWRDRIDLGDPLHVAALMVAAGDADGCVAGAIRPTADVVRAALYCIGVAADVGLLSSSFLMLLPDGQSVVFGDCGVVPDPDSDQLASIAIASANTFAQLTNDQPFVAMLSYSTMGSADGPSVQRVRAATELVRQRAPHLAVDGELQFDAAWVPEVAEIKAADSKVAGRANVFVFPDLSAGNIAYKITERLGGAQAFGPLLQGTASIIHDLSRGCSFKDIVSVATIAACQAARSAA